MIAIAQSLNTAVNDFLNDRANGINWEKEPLPDKWSNKEILGHLIDSANINLQRFIRCTYEDCFKLIYFQEEWVAAQHYRDADAAELLQLWRLVNLQIVRVLNNYPADRISVMCDNGRDEVTFFTVEYIAKDYIVHMQHHLAQLEGNVK